MLDYDLFNEWLKTAHTFSARTATSITSRLKRANNICAIPAEIDDMYYSRLKQMSEFKALDVFVRSHLMRAVRLFSEYQNGCAANAKKS